jgi:nucleotide-binding universal stress UspA family protein
MLRFPESKLHVHKIDEQSEQRGKDYLKGLVARAGSQRVPIDLTVRLGVPATEIIKVAKETRVDLIVMSTHGTTGIERDQHSIGSTAWRVLHDAPCPVLLIPVRPAG